MPSLPWESSEILGVGEILAFQLFFAILGMTISTTSVAVQVMQVQRHIILSDTGLEKAFVCWN